MVCGLGEKHAGQYSVHGHLPILPEAAQEQTSQCPLCELLCLLPCQQQVFPLSGQRQWSLLTKGNRVSTSLQLRVFKGSQKCSPFVGGPGPSNEPLSLAWGFWGLSLSPNHSCCSLHVPGMALTQSLCVLPHPSAETRPSHSSFLFLLAFSSCQTLMSLMGRFLVLQLISFGSHLVLSQEDKPCSGTLIK